MWAASAVVFVLFWLAAEIVFVTAAYLSLE